MTRLSPEMMARGRIDRHVVESCRGFCDECQVYTSQWTDYGSAVAQYIEHRMEVHYAPDSLAARRAADGIAPELAQGSD